MVEEQEGVYEVESGTPRTIDFQRRSRSLFMQEHGSSRSRHSQNRRTLIPDEHKCFLTLASLCLLRASFLLQYVRFALGVWPHLGHPCQKHPSTKTAMRSFGKKKSGHPGTAFARTCQPATRFLIRRARRRNSVVAFELALIARMFLLLCGVVLNFIEL